MKHKVLFGPAGSPVDYKGAAYKAPKYINEEGLDSYEYQSPYGVRIGEKAATTLKEESKKHDVLVSMHAPYYINLCAKDEEKLDKSIGHLIAAARAGEWMGAYRLVFHPGAYMNRKPQKAMEISKNTVNRLFEELEAREHSLEMSAKWLSCAVVLTILNLQSTLRMFMQGEEVFLLKRKITIAYFQQLKTNWILISCIAILQQLNMGRAVKLSITCWTKATNTDRTLRICSKI